MAKVLGDTPERTIRAMETKDSQLVQSWFDGDNDSITNSFNPDTAIGDGNAFTISAWVWIGNDGSMDGGFGAILNCYGADPRFYIYIQDTGNDPFVGLGNIFKVYTASPTVANTTWTHLALVFHGSIGDIYQNGIYISSETFGTSKNFPSSSTSLGANGTVYNWGGGLDSILIYNRAVTSNECLTLSQEFD